MATEHGTHRQELQLALKRGFKVPFAAQGELATNRQARSSAVLILFGQLDHVPAQVARETQRVSADLDVLLLRRSDAMPTHAGQLAFPGGGVEQGDISREATALREAHEETGLDPRGVDILGTLPEVHIPVSNYLVTPVLAWWRSPSEVLADQRESVEVFRVPIAELVDPAARGTSVLRRAGSTWRGPAFQLSERFGGHVIWGFTAMLLTGIFDSAGWAEPWDKSRLFELRR